MIEFFDWHMCNTKAISKNKNSINFKLALLAKIFAYKIILNVAANLYFNLRTQLVRPYMLNRMKI